ncbi:hypothetical protein SAMN02745157_2533 [Kaistia soli DSM 19436]|uniref:Uncharacterized protein n=1 Tax=Kaistia soli DSM 19436 TaxID=1122133 RepID=A0A1M5D250_9HYPH|nr:hypothetical protein [Kaistia soli]SHF60892.1 hypothetical protein SAMN02745157_2533 [Kaistia soli DSM 19436]
MLQAARAIDRFAVPLTLYQTQPTTYVNHKPVTHDPIEIAIRGVIQPAKGNQMQDMPEGVRIDAGWLLWTRAEVGEGDIVADAAGLRYRAMWLCPRAEGGFVRAVLERFR